MPFANKSVPCARPIVNRERENRGASAYPSPRAEHRSWFASRRWGMLCRMLDDIDAGGKTHVSLRWQSHTPVSHTQLLALTPRSNCCQIASWEFASCLFLYHREYVPLACPFPCRGFNPKGDPLASRLSPTCLVLLCLLPLKLEASS